MILPSRRWYLVAAALAAVAPVAALWSPAARLFLALDLLWLLALGLDAYRAAGLDPQRLEIRRETPPAFSVGRAVPIRYRWRSPFRGDLTLKVRETLPALFAGTTAFERELSLRPDRETIEEHLLRPIGRGHAAAAPLDLRLLGPLGLAWRQGRVEVPWDLMVYPNLGTALRRALPTQSQRRREAGQRQVRRLGEGRLFESLREWVPGDDTRTIDWKATARRGKLMVRQYEDERRQRVMVVVDAGRLLTAEIGGRARLEDAIEAAAQLAHSAITHDDDAGLLVFADRIQCYLAPARGPRALRAVLNALTGVEGRVVEPDYPAAFAFLAARTRKRALTVVFTDVIDRTASEALVLQLGSLRPRHLPLTVTLRDPALEGLATARPATAEASFQRAAAEELLQARGDALTEMRRRGVLVLDVLPAAAARAVVERYVQLKRRAVI